MIKWGQVNSILLSLPVEDGDCQKKMPTLYLEIIKLDILLKKRTPMKWSCHANLGEKTYYMESMNFQSFLSSQSYEPSVISILQTQETEAIPAAGSGT